MKENLSKPLFWSNIVSLTFVGLVAAGLAYGWNSPSASPIGGSGAISTDVSGNVGVGTAPSSSYQLNSAGYVRGATGLCIGSDCRSAWPTSGSGTVTSLSAGFGITLSPSPLTTSGTVSVNPVTVQQRVSGTCAAGSSIRAIAQDGVSVTCEADDTGSGGVTGSGTSGSIAVWNGATSIGNPSGTITVPADFSAASNSWGTQSTVAGPTAGNASGYWGGALSCSANACPWTMQCPAGYYVIGVTQTQMSGGLSRPGIICAQL